MKACFVCGDNFSDVKAMIDHVIACHNESTDYVLCPCCSSPVRDIRSHYKVMHMDKPVPNIAQMKAKIWRTLGSSHKERKKRTVWLEGNFHSQKNDRMMHHRSGMELSLYQALERIPAIARYEVEPFAITYIFNGSARQYFPDLKVIMTDGRHEIWEVKPMSQTKMPINQAKWDAAAEYCHKNGIRFKVITERGVGDMRKSVGLPRRLAKARRTVVPDDDGV